MIKATYERYLYVVGFQPDGFKDVSVLFVVDASLLHSNGKNFIWSWSKYRSNIVELDQS